VLPSEVQMLGCTSRGLREFRLVGRSMGTFNSLAEWGELRRETGQ